jgi:hypothetical protein
MIAQSEDRCLPQMPSAKCCRELVKPEIVGVEFSTFCNSLEVIQEIQLWKRDGPCRYPRSGQPSRKRDHPSRRGRIEAWDLSGHPKPAKEVI